VYLPRTPWQEVVTVDRDLAKRTVYFLFKANTFRQSQIIDIPVEIQYITKIFAMVFSRLGWAVSGEFSSCTVWKARMNDFNDLNEVPDVLVP
jgi:hypothetical protein